VARTPKSEEPKSNPKYLLSMKRKQIEKEQKTTLRRSVFYYLISIYLL